MVNRGSVIHSTLSTTLGAIRGGCLGSTQRARTILDVIESFLGDVLRDTLEVLGERQVGVEVGFPERCLPEQFKDFTDGNLCFPATPL